MALPGLSLPGLGGLNQPLQSSAAGASAFSTPSQTRTETLQARTEWRFEAPFTGTYTIRLLSGTAEIFGSELAPNLLYTFSGVKAAVFTWQGCQLEIAGEAESEYVGSETDYATEWLNAHGMLETARDDAEAQGRHGGGGPRVLVVGPEGVGKSTLVRTLSAWAVKMGRTPTIVNLDPREGLLVPPGSLVAVTTGSQMEPESGYGSAPVSGPTATPIKTPLIYHYPYHTPAEKPVAYKAITTRMATAVTSKLEEDMEAKYSGLIIDTPGALSNPRKNYDLISHIVSEFSITLILALGSERLYNDLNRRFAPNSNSSSDAVTVLRIAKPGGAVERDADFLKSTRQQETRQYFFGTSKETLNPHSQQVPFNDISIYRAKSLSDAASTDATDDAFKAPSTGENDDDEYGPSAASSSSKALLEKVTPTTAMTGSLVAIKFCPGTSDESVIRDSAVMGFLYVADVDETRKRVRFLAPHPQRWGDRALVWGGWPEAVGGLLS